MIPIYTHLVRIIGHNVEASHRGPSRSMFLYLTRKVALWRACEVAGRVLAQIELRCMVVDIRDLDGHGGAHLCHLVVNIQIFFLGLWVEEREAN